MDDYPFSPQSDEESFLNYPLFKSKSSSQFSKDMGNDEKDFGKIESFTDMLDDIDILNTDTKSAKYKELGHTSFAHEWSSKTLPKQVRKAYLKALLKSASQDMLLKRIDDKQKNTESWIQVAGSDEDVPILEESIDSESVSKEDVLHKSVVILPTELSQLKSRLEKSNKDLVLPRKEFTAYFRQRTCFRDCWVLQIFFLLAAHLELISKGAAFPISLIIIAWQGITLSYVGQPGVRSSKDIIRRFIHDIQFFKDLKHVFKETKEMVLLYKNNIGNSLTHFNSQASQAAASLQIRLNDLYSKGEENAQYHWEKTEREFKYLIEECKYLAITYQEKLEKKLDYLIKVGKEGTNFYQEKLQNEFEYLIDLSSQIAISIKQTKNDVSKVVTKGGQKALSYPRNLVNESTAALNYLWRLLANRMDANSVLLKNQLSRFAYKLGDSVSEGAMDHLLKTAQKNAKAISNAETIVYNMAFESAERTGAGIYFGFKRRLLSEILRILFFVIPTFVIGSFTYQYMEEWFDSDA